MPTTTTPQLARRAWTRRETAALDALRFQNNWSLREFAVVISTTTGRPISEATLSRLFRGRAPARLLIRLTLREYLQHAHGQKVPR